MITKGDGENNILRWAAVDGDLLGDAYQSAWDIPTEDLIECYAIMQKWLDQGISADLFRRFGPGEVTVSEDEVVRIFLKIIFLGLKSRYYTNTLRPKVKDTAKQESLVNSIPGVAAAVAATAAEAAKEATDVIAQAMKPYNPAEPDHAGVIHDATPAYMVGRTKFEFAQAKFGTDYLVSFAGMAPEGSELPSGEGKNYGDSYLIGNKWYVWNTQEWVNLYTHPSDTTIEYVESEQDDACADGACKL